MSAQPEDVDLSQLNPQLDADDTPADRAQSIIALKVAGATYGQIARLLDFPDIQSARVAAERVLASSVTDEDRERHRTLIDMRLGALWTSVYRKASNPKHPEHLQAVRIALGILDRAAKLHGADAPTEISVHNPAKEEIANWVAGMMSKQAEQWPREADVIGELDRGDG